MGVEMKKVVGWGAAAFTIYYIIQDPEGSAQFFKKAGHEIGKDANSLGTFVGSLIGPANGASTPNGMPAEQLKPRPQDIQPVAGTKSVVVFTGKKA